MQSDKRNVKHIVLCALASVSMAAIAGDRYGISVYGYSTEQGYQRQIYGGSNGVYRYYVSPTQDSASRRTEDLIAAASRVAPTKGITNNHVPIIPLLPTVGINLPITAVTLKVITTGTIKGSNNGEPRHGTRNSDRRNKN